MLKAILKVWIVVLAGVVVGRHAIEWLLFLPNHPTSFSWQNFTLSIKHRLMDSAYILFRSQRTTDHNVTECEWGKQRALLTAASSVYDSTKHNGLVTQFFRWLFLTLNFAIQIVLLKLCPQLKLPVCLFNYKFRPGPGLLSSKINWTNWMYCLTQY